MGISMQGPGKGELTAPSRKDQKARLAKFGPVANARVALAKQQSSNGFKGESLNDHGLPDGREQKDIARVKENGAKFRAQKYADGTQGIKVKKNSMASREAAMETQVARNEDLSPAARGSSDSDLDAAASSVLSNWTPTSMPALGKKPTGLVRGGTEKVAQYQRDLNAKGANLKVDGAWGKLTQAAYDSQQKARPRSSPAYSKAKLGAIMATDPENTPSAPKVKMGNPAPSLAASALNPVATRTAQPTLKASVPAAKSSIPEVYVPFRASSFKPGPGLLSEDELNKKEQNRKEVINAKQKSKIDAQESARARVQMEKAARGNRLNELKKYDPKLYESLVAKGAGVKMKTSSSIPDTVDVDINTHPAFKTVGKMRDKKGQPIKKAGKKILRGVV